MCLCVCVLAFDLSVTAISFLVEATSFTDSTVMQSVSSICRGYCSGASSIRGLSALAQPTDTFSHEAGGDKLCDRLQDWSFVPTV